MQLAGMVIVGVLAIAGGIVGNYTFLRFQRKLDRENLKGGFLGEITALNSIVKKRKYIEHLEGVLDTMKKDRVKLPFTFEVTYNYFRVYENNVDKLGLLNQPLPELIVQFYTQCFATLEDIDRIKKIAIKEIPIENLVAWYSELLSLFKDNVKLGEKIIHTIKN